MRAFDCTLDDVRLLGADDEELVRKAREHVDRDHPDLQMSDDELRRMIGQGAYDAPATSSAP